ncbi:MAG: putative 7-carboxy-7-deazaguanine synthase QueE [Clostridium sp.]|nr:putative 7-carboxy-7-deazaguanine synthase QueE [Clostridium sp.]
MFKVIEKFLSIDGEGPTQGELSTFIRFQGCNLRCKWCDTKYSYDTSESFEVLSGEEIYNYIKSNETYNVTLTGGEPLIQPNIEELLMLLSKDKKLKINIETNGAIAIKPFKSLIPSENIRYIIDFKLPDSGMTEFMNIDNFKFLTKRDVYKFVIASMNDLRYAENIIKKYELISKCQVYFSPVFGSINLQDIVEFMKSNKLNGVRLQVQMHKIIWGMDERGV